MISISVAPMMDCTDRHDRYFLRQISPHVILYSEMITAQALVYGNRERLLAFHPAENYIVLQLGGSNPQQLADSAKMGEEAGYNEINLNVGCPSNRVKSGNFGACLMLDPILVADCIDEMQKAVSIPVTVKCRIGVDDKADYKHLHHFVTKLDEIGCNTLIIHARKALLNGLSPKQNREIPPLEYEKVYAIKRDFPHLKILLNGGIKSVEDIKEHINKVDGIMIGRGIYHNPYFLAEIEKEIYGNTTIPSRSQIIRQLYPYIESELNRGTKLSHMTRHLFDLFKGEKNAASWRRYLTQHAYKENAGSEILEQGLAAIQLSHS